MSEALPAIYLARHGETAWSISGQHTGLTDLPLTERGERNATRLGGRLQGMQFAKVSTSPLQRTSLTCKLAGFAGAAEVDPDLVEWNYGNFEGLKTSEIYSNYPHWQLFCDGCPGGNISRPGCCTRRPCDCTSKGSERRRAPFLKWAFSPHARSQMATT